MYSGCLRRRAGERISPEAWFLKVPGFLVSVNLFLLEKKGKGKVLWLFLLVLLHWYYSFLPYRRVHACTRVRVSACTRDFSFRVSACTRKNLPSARVHPTYCGRARTFGISGSPPVH